MSKITFRADDDLVRQLEEFDASKSEVMREALRAYLRKRGASGPTAGNEGVGSEPSGSDGTVDELIAERVDEIVESRLADVRSGQGAQDVNVNISLEGATGDIPADAAPRGEPATARASGPEDAASESPPEKTPDACKQCGEELSPSAVYCPNCGEKANHRSFCECGDEIRSDWAFCPSCGRRTPAANVLGDS